MFVDDIAFLDLSWASKQTARELEQPSNNELKQYKTPYQAANSALATIQNTLALWWQVPVTFYKETLKNCVVLTVESHS